MTKLPHFTRTWYFVQTAKSQHFCGSPCVLCADDPSLTTSGWLKRQWESGKIMLDSRNAVPHIGVRSIVTALAGDSKMNHGTDIRDAITIIVRKDNWIPAKPWFADVVFPDGHKWRGWQEFYSTKKALLQAINAAAPNATVEFQ